jgi:hypothetical protein
MDNVAKSPFMNGSKTIAILADLPVWTIPGYAHLRSPGHYATWLEPLIPEFESHKDLNIHWVTFSKNVSERQLIRVYGQTIHVLPRKSKMFAMLLGYLPEIVAVRRMALQALSVVFLDDSSRCKAVLLSIFVCLVAIGYFAYRQCMKSLRFDDITWELPRVRGRVI